MVEAHLHKRLIWPEHTMDGGGRGIIGTVIKRQCIFHSVSKHAECGKEGSIILKDIDFVK